MILNFKEMIDSYQKFGLSVELASARVCQDVVLKAISLSPFGKNVTVKGGVVMQSLTQNIRRSTRDLDLDFIHYSLEDSSIQKFVESLNCLDGVSLVIDGVLEELKHQDYHGKSASLKIVDNFGTTLKCKIDFGVHKRLELTQEEFCFDVAFDEQGVCLLKNSVEQAFAEKLRSLLIFGPYSRRFKDIFDMFFLKDVVDKSKLAAVVRILIFEDEEMREGSFDEIIKRLDLTFKDSQYIKRLGNSRQRWLDNDIHEICEGLLKFVNNLER